MMRPGKQRKEPQMRKTATLLAAAIIPLVAGMGIAADSNAEPTMSDQAYCKALVQTLRNVDLGSVRGLPVGNATAVAIAQCDEGDTGPAIPVLEQQLRERDTALPTRN